MNGKRMEPGRMYGSQVSPRLYFLAGIAGLFFCVVIFRLASLQIFTGYYYGSLKKNQSETRLVLPAKRGDILDRNGEKLAYDIEQPISAGKLNSLARMNEEVAPQMTSGKRNVEYRKLKRIYPNQHLAGQVLGFIGRDGYGLAGVEYSFDDVLRGKSGWAFVGRDGKRRKYPLQGTLRQAPEAGCHIRLSIDARLQAIVEDALKNGIQRTAAKQGMALVMDPKTGEILSMASYPFVNPNLSYDRSGRNWKNLPVSLVYEPGSTFKVVSAAAAVDQQIKTGDDLIDGDNGVFVIYNEEIHDHEPYGLLSFRKALAYSSNVCFAKLACDIGNANLYKYARALGYGSRTGVLLPGEESGTLHPLTTWSGRTLVTMAIGHEVSGTLLQSAMAFGAIANDGILMKPNIIKEITDASGEVLRSFKAEPIRRVLSESSARELRRYLGDVVSYGTGKNIQVEGLQIAGKTGTAEKIDAESRKYLHDKVMASFIGFVPADSPELLCAVTIDEPQTARFGALAAGPVFREIVTRAMHAPELHYAEKIIENEPAPFGDVNCARIPDFRGKDGKSAEYLARVEGFRVRMVGRGNNVIEQVPAPGITVESGYQVILFLETSTETEKISIPSLAGKSVREAVQVLNFLGMSVKIRGSGIVTEQYPLPGAKVHSGTLCMLKCNTEA